jgi:cytochrome c-type biogenesis protein CcmI
MLIALGVLLVAAAFAVPLLIRETDLPAPEPVSPTRHLEERKATIYENLRDLQAEYRMGKLSDEDYQATKQELQRELAVAMARIEEIEGRAAAKSDQEPAA